MYLEKSCQGNDLTHNLPLHRGVYLPKHMIPPGQDGYRTPTVEDYERYPTSCAPEHHDHNTESNCDPHAHLPTSHSGPTQHLHNLSGLNVGYLIGEKLQWRERIRHFTWTFFTMTMATGGIANVIHNVPFRFRGLETVGIIFFLFNILLFVLNVTFISLRFYTYPETFRASFMHPSERLFMPAAVVSFGTILINISQYGLSKSGPWLSRGVLVLFWLDATLALVSSAGIYLLMWSTRSFTISQMTPIWIFPAYPLLIIGPHAGVLSKTLKPDQALDIIIGGYTIQGIGFMVSMMIYSAFIYRLMTQKLPQESIRPGMFVSVGPSGFTVAGVLAMAEALQRALPNDFMGDGALTAMILRVMANWMSLWIWGLALWFFFVSVGAHWSCVGRDRMTFGMTWFSFVFPNTALVTSTFAIGKAFGSKAIQITGCVMASILILVWFFVFTMMIRAIILKQILWPQKGEDKDEGGFKGPVKRSDLKTIQNVSAV